jgi:hypothetical protein
MLVILYETGEETSRYDLLSFDFSTELHGINDGTNSKSNVNIRGKKKDAELPVFSYESVLAATNNFSIANKLGQGGFGPVYKVYMIHFPDEFASKLLRQPIMVNLHGSLKSLWFSFIGENTKGAGNSCKNAFKNIWTRA